MFYINVLNSSLNARNENICFVSGIKYNSLNPTPVERSRGADRWRGRGGTKEWKETEQKKGKNREMTCVRKRKENSSAVFVQRILFPQRCVWNLKERAAANLLINN